MTREGAIHLTCLYGPLVSAGMLAWWVRPGKLHATGLLFALAWNAALLPWLDGFARMSGMWTYHSQTAAIGGMPLALYFGWIIAWGLARWSENQDMRGRFGAAWCHDHQSVRPWWPRWHPRIGEECELWFDMECGPCSEVARWFQQRKIHGLQLRAAADWPGTPLVRVTWHHPPSGRTEVGVGAIAMALQHLSLPWAFIGWAAGLPGISHSLQICFDAAGAGKLTRPPASSDKPSG